MIVHVPLHPMKNENLEEIFEICPMVISNFTTVAGKFAGVVWLCVTQKLFAWDIIIIQPLLLALNNSTCVIGLA